MSRTKSPDLIQSVEGTKIDLRHHVLAENVVVYERPDRYGTEVTFDFLCPNRGQRHWATEMVRNGFSPFPCVRWLLPCGEGIVRIPWAQTPVRDKKDIYETTPWFSAV